MEALKLVTWVAALITLAMNVAWWTTAARRFREWRVARRRREEPPRWPAVHVFVCLKGDLPDLPETSAALNDQDYPGEYRVTFLTESAPGGSDPAAGKIARLVPSLPRCDHAVAGRVLETGARCAQKNYNLLAGIRHATERRNGIEVYAFCDGDQLVQKDWLREMIRPIAHRDSEATTSLHYATTEERSLVGAMHGMAETAQSWASLVVKGTTWGGSMAIRADEFERLELADLWSRTCVDDISMSRVLRRGRIRVTAVPQFLVSSRSGISNLRSFVRWLGRQFFFVKVYLPARWYLLWAKFLLDVASIWLSAFHISHRVVQGDWASGAPAALAIVAASGAALGTFQIYRLLLPERPPFRPWLGATFLMHGAAILACVDAALRRRRLVWSDMSYQVQRNGDVVDVAPHPAKPGSESADVREEAVA